MTKEQIGKLVLEVAGSYLDYKKDIHVSSLWDFVHTFLAKLVGV